MERKVIGDVCCRHCGDPLVRAGASIRDMPRKGVESMSYRKAYEIVIGNRLVVIARCRQCGERTSFGDCVVAYKMVPWSHKCGCGCGYTVNAQRKVRVLRYSGSQSEPQGVATTTTHNP